MQALNIEDQEDQLEFDEDKQDEDQALALRLLCSAVSLKTRLYDYGEVPEQPIVTNDLKKF